jgi:ArsR family transcriptional regulator
MATIFSRSTTTNQNPNGALVQAETSINADRTNADTSLADGVAKELVRWFKLLADETRLKILFLLLEGEELNVRSLCDVLELSQPAVSHHLALLRVDGLIECRRDGKHNFYRVLPHRFGDLMGKILEAVPGDESHLQFGTISLDVSQSKHAASDVAPEAAGSRLTQ